MTFLFWSESLFFTLVSHVIRYYNIIVNIAYRIDMRKIMNIPKETSVLVWKEGNLFVAKSLEVEIASQGSTKEESLANLKEALELYFEKELSLPNIFPYKNVSLEKLTVSYA